MIIGAKRRIVTRADGDNGVDSNISMTHFSETRSEADDDCLEPWVDFIKRATHDAEEKLHRLDIEDWVSAQRRRKWNVAHRIAMQSSDRWSNRAATWNPDLTSNVAARPQGRPKKRWHDDINELLKELLNKDTVDRMEVAKDEAAWHRLTTHYVKGH